VYAKEDEPQAWEDLIGCIERVRAKKTPNASTGPLADGLQYGCCIARFGCSALPHVLPAKQHFLESRRADSNRFSLLQLRVCGRVFLDVAHACISRINKRFIVPWFAHYCRKLRPG
jgi:hypothetical protein